MLLRGAPELLTAGTEPLPLEDAFQRLGLKVSQGADSAVFIEADSAADASAVAIRGSLIGQMR